MAIAYNTLIHREYYGLALYKATSENLIQFKFSER